MAYSEKSTRNARNIQYVKEHQKQIQIKYKNEEYQQHILPAIKKTGLPVATFIKQAIEEKIIRDQL